MPQPTKFKLFVYLFIGFSMGSLLTTRWILSDKVNWLEWQPSDWRGVIVGYLRTDINKIDTKHNGSSSFYGPFLNLTCKFPVLDPYDKSILKYIKHPRGHNCSEIQPWLSHVTEDGYLTLNGSYSIAFDCQFRSISGGPPNKTDQKRTYSPWKPILPGEKVLVTTVAVEIKCNATDEFGNNTIIYENLHPFPVFLENEDKPEKSDESHLSVLLFGLDSVSYGAYRRHLSSTNDYLLNKMGQIVFRGYTKIGDNTFPNMAAVLMGKRLRPYGPGLPEEMGNVTMGNIYFDDWPWIWKDFKDKGYATSHIEDEPHTGMFHYLKKGFKNPPTDWYMRPFFTARRKTKLRHRSTKRCFGNIPNVANNLDIVSRILKRHQTDRYFLVNFISSLSHDYTTPLELADDLFEEFFRKNKPYLKNTIVIFMSDHGSRFSSVRYTQVGLIEERMPVFSMILPPWFSQKYPDAIENLKYNQWRLSTNYDAYETLKDILDGNYHGEQRPKSSRGQSLFYPIALGRDCASAEIPDVYCSCAHYTPVSTNDSIVSQVAEFMVEHVNRMVQAKYSDKCELLTLKKIERAELYKTNQDTIQGYKSVAQKEKQQSQNNKLKPSVVNQYQIIVTAGPSDARLEGIVLHNLTTNQSAIHNQVSRTNRYGSQSSCINDDIIRLYCYCKK